MAGRSETDMYVSNSIRGTDSMHSFDVPRLARLPLTVRIPSSDRGGLVVDLTGDSDEEEVDEVVDLTSPVMEDVVGVERDAVGGPTGMGAIAPVTVSYSIAPPPSLHLHSSSDDDVILVSSQPPISSLPPPSHAIPEQTVPPSPLSPSSGHLNITCPICMETHKSFSLSGHCLVTTKCGHLFCDNCLKKSISLTHKCPTCSSKLTLRQYHRIYV